MIARWGLFFAWVIAILSFLGSLYFSDILKIEPCHLCWYQRIIIYPLVIILGIAAWRGTTEVVPYIAPLVAIGVVIALYQVAIQEIPGFEPFHVCGAGPSCTEKEYIGLGFITIPMLSAASLAAIFWLILHARRNE